MSLVDAESFDDGMYSIKAVQSASDVTPTTAHGRNGIGFPFRTASTWYQRSLGADQHATVIVGFAMRHPQGQSGTVRFFQLMESATTHLSMRLQASGALDVYRGDVTTQLGASVAGIIPQNVWCYVEIKAVIDDVAGAVEVRVNGVVVITLTGIDTRNGGSGLIDSVRWNVGANINQWHIDDIYICNGAGTVNNDFLGDCIITPHLPSGNGASSQLVGSDGNSVDNYALVDDAAPSMADYLASGVDGEKDTYIFPDLPVGAGIRGVLARVYGMTSDAGAKGVRALARVDAVDYVGADKPLISSASLVTEKFEVNPATSAPWTAAEYNAAEFGVEVRP